MSDLLGTLGAVRPRGGVEPLQLVFLQCEEQTDAVDVLMKDLAGCTRLG